MSAIRSTVYMGDARRRIAAFGVLTLIAFYAQLTFAGPADAAPFSGGVSPTIISNLADSTVMVSSTLPTTRTPSTATRRSSTARSTATPGAHW